MSARNAEFARIEKESADRETGLRKNLMVKEWRVAEL